jgi:hypothetical protein
MKRRVPKLQQMGKKVKMFSTFILFLCSLSLLERGEACLPVGRDEEV